MTLFTYLQRSKLENQENFSWFTIFTIGTYIYSLLFAWLTSVVFELISAYGTVGLSLGIPGVSAVLLFSCVAFSILWPSKTIRFLELYPLYQSLLFALWWSEDGTEGYRSLLTEQLFFQTSTRRQAWRVMLPALLAVLTQKTDNNFLNDWRYLNNHSSCRPISSLSRTQHTPSNIIDTNAGHSSVNQL